MTHDIRDPGPEFLEFWRDRHFCTLATRRPDGSPHLVPVGVTYDPETGLARVIANRHSRKVANILAETRREADARAGASTDGAPGARVAVCQVAAGRWATLEGRARVRTDPEAVADAVARYAERYSRTPAPNPDRVVIEITLDRAMGRP
ncbi:pyridoxamine 5'-phosphate oxidase family protein [Streptomyces sp. 8L]|uniref:pyridoxamine 5'-phosphate oxidase family protein n=1 Tax=Streptomyces sp. 8L TaxID=2877242 RepID=UPI001CD1CCF8|nr:pyridoxamine 5'-phosphate oxidase family protein [Streptomyces sp. 8L]MCA1220898.1 pyridoxamine 5'-phosphate oxidase family protein [Streptomyces sp. 8L]